MEFDSILYRQGEAQLNKAKIKTLLLVTSIILSMIYFSPQVIIPTAQATTYFTDGFETGDYSAWTATVNASVETTSARHGAYGSYHTGNAIGDSYLRRDYTAMSEVYLDFSIRLEALSDFQQVGLGEIKFGATTTIFAVVFRDRGANYDVAGRRFYPTTVDFDSADFAYTLNDYVHVEIMFREDATNGTYAVWVDDVLRYSVTGLDTSGSPTPSSAIVGVFYYSMASGSAVSYDTVRISDVFLSDYTETSADASDDFNDGSIGGWWNYNYESPNPTVISWTETSYALYFTIASGTYAAIGQIGNNNVNFTLIDMQVDAYIPPGEVGNLYIMLGNTSIWHRYAYWILFSSNYGGIVEVYKRDGTSAQTRIYTGSWFGRHTQLRIVTNTTHIKFYQQETLLYEEDATWLFSGYGEVGNIGLGAQRIGTETNNGLGYFDNFFYYLGVRNVKRVIRETHYTLKYVTFIMPSHNWNFSDPITSYYPINLNLSHYGLFMGLTGWEIGNWTITTAGGSTNYNDNPHFEQITENYNISVTIILSSGFRILTVEAYSLGVSPSRAYGEHALAYNGNYTTTATLVTLNPPGLYPEWVGWYRNGVFNTSSTSITVTLNANITISSNATFQTPAGTWRYRSMNTMVDIAPAYPVNGTGFTDIIDRLVANVSPSGQISHVAVRVFWAWNLTTNEPYLYDDEVQHPSLAQLAVAIDAIQARGFEASLIIAHLWGDSAPVGWDWTNMTAVIPFLTAYYNNVISPVASFAETNAVDILGINAEITLPYTPDDIPTYFNSTTLNDKWVDIITDTRTLFTGVLTSHEASHYGTVGFNALEVAYYFSYLDFVILATWRDGLALSEPYTAYDIASGYFDAPTGGSEGRNTMQDMQDLYESWGVRISLNLGWHNAYGVNLVSPWSGAGAGEFRFDSSSTEAWKGAMWATQPQSWSAGLDFERYNEYYDLGLPATYTSASIALVEDTEEAIRDFMTFTLNNQVSIGAENVTILDLEASSYVFAETKYYDFEAIYTHNSNVSNLGILRFQFTNVGLNITVTYNHQTGSLSANSSAVQLSLIDSTISDASRKLTLNIGVYFTNDIKDDTNSDIFMWANETGGDTFGWIQARNNYFNIYNQGGGTSLTSSGNAGRTVGGDVFEVYAYNSSWVLVNSTWINLQHIFFLFHVEVEDQRTWDDFEADNITIEMGIDYNYNNTWIRGWNVYLEQVEGWLASSTMRLQWNVTWFNRGVLIKSTTMNTFPVANQTGDSGIKASTSFLLDLWFASTNSSSVVAGRITAEYYAMRDNANAWLRWATGSNWGADLGNASQVMGFFDLLDADGNVIYADDLDFMRVWVRLEQGDNANNIRWELKDFDIADYTLAQGNMEGIATPSFTATKTPNMPQIGFFGAMAMLFNNLYTILSNLWGVGMLLEWTVFTAFLDSVAGWLGYPLFFSTLFTTIGSLWNWFVSGLTQIVKLLAVFFLMFASVADKMMNALTQAATTFTSMIAIIFSMLNGAYGVGVDLWVTLNLWQWFILGLILYPIFLLGLWETQGFDAMLGHLLMVKDVFAFIGSTIITVLEFFINLVSRIIEAIPIAE